MKRHYFLCIEDWYTAQRILGALAVSYNSFAETDGKRWVIEL